MLEREDEAAYFVDSEGELYRIHDVAFGPPLAAPGRKRVMPRESPDANPRYFISANGVARAYRFTRKEDRTLSVERLQKQLNGAGFVSSFPRSLNTRKPT